MLSRNLRAAEKFDLTIVEEKDALRETRNVFWKTTKTSPIEGAWSMHTPHEHVRGKDLRKRLSGHTAGEPLPDWHDGGTGALRVDTYVMRVRDAFHMPEYGAVFDRRGQLFRKTVAEARYVSPTLSQLPGLRVKRDALRFTAPADLPRVGAATVFMPWGGRFNYGHFLLDALSGLAVIDDMNGLESHPPITPPLSAWQRDLLRLYLGDRPIPVREIDAEIVTIDDAVFTNCMDHFLHAPNPILALVRERIMANAARVAPHQEAPKRLYLERTDDKRVMVNQDKFINLLKLRGFSIVQPERLSPAEQVMLFSQAEIIVGATGAGLTNAMFAPLGAKVFEIQPSNFTGIWMRQMCDVLGLGWYGFFCESPLQTTDFYTEGKLRSDVMFQYRLPLDPFLAFLAKRAGI